MRRTALLCAVIACGCSAKTGGPTPQIASIMPAPICDAQQAITIAGSGFSPVVRGALTSSPAVVMPRIFLVDGSGAQTEVPAAGVSVPDTSGTALVVAIPQALVRVVYSRLDNLLTGASNAGNLAITMGYRFVF